MGAAVRSWLASPGLFAKRDQEIMPCLDARLRRSLGQTSSEPSTGSGERAKIYKRAACEPISARFYEEEQLYSRVSVCIVLGPSPSRPASNEQTTNRTCQHRREIAVKARTSTMSRGAIEGAGSKHSRPEACNKQGGRRVVRRISLHRGASHWSRRAYSER